jgi:uncharacterized protein (TIGR03437 family)
MVRLFLLLAVTSLHAADSPLLYRKVFGGSGTDTVTGLTVDPNGYPIVAGTTTSYNFPVTDSTRNLSTHFAESPDSAATWRPLGSLPAGTPRSLAVDGSTWYAAGKTGIYTSTDGGATWTTSLALADCNPFDPMCGASYLNVSRQASTLYAVATGQILKSADAGATWNPLHQPIDAERPGASFLRLDPFHPGHLFTYVYPNAYRSFDDGANWTPYTTPGFTPQYCGMTAPAFDQVRENLVYVIDHCAVYRSNDAGLNWNLVDTPFHNPLNIDTTATGAIFVRDVAGLWVSTDASLTWNLILPIDPTRNPMIFLAQDPTNPNIVLTTSQRTDDGGATWHPLTLGRNINAVVFDPAHPGRAIAATDGAAAGFIAKLGYGGDIMAATYVNSTSIAGVANDPAGNIYVAGGRADQTYFAAKFDSDLNPVYSLVLPDYTYVQGIAVDSTGSVAILGSAPPQPKAQWQCLVTKLTPDAGIAFRTMFGSTNGDNCSAIAADASGNTVVASFLNFRATLTKLDPSGNIVFSQPVNQTNGFGAQSITTDAAGNIYLTGETSAKDYLTTDGAYQSKVNSNCAYPSSAVATGIIGTITSNDNSDTFVQKLDANGSLIWSTLLGGGCLDLVTGIAVDGSNNVWLTGRTNSSPFPQVSGFESGPAYAYYKAFVSQLDPNGAALKLSSYLTAGDSPLIATDAFGNTYVAGSTTPPLFYASGPCCAAPPKDVHASLTKLQSVPPAPLAITAAGNAFSLRNGPVTAGQITLITATGLTPDAPQDLTLKPTDPLPRSLSGVQVLFDGEAAPIVSVAPGRVVAVAPYGIAGKRQTSIQLTFNGVLSAPVLADVLRDVAYLSRDGSGTGQAVAFNPDGTPNSSDNPAPTNAMVTVFATGNGSVPGCPAGSVDSATGYLCGIFKTQIHTPTQSLSTVPLPNSALTVAVK